MIKKAASLALLTLSLANCLLAQGKVETKHKAEILYNGIELPGVWPPNNMDPASSNPMLVPYLTNPPQVISINVGRQLFVDDFLIEHTNLKRKYYAAEIYKGTPVFFPQTASEMGSPTNQSAVTYLGHGGVFYDPKTNCYQMFYTAGWRGALAIATSKDLVNWNRPSLKLSKDNNILEPGPTMAGGDNAIWLDLNTTDTMKRYKAIIERLVDGAWAENYAKKELSPTHTLHTSSDGRIWSQGVVAGRVSDYSSFFYNPFRNTWVYSLKQNTVRGRARYYAESKDFLKGAGFENKVYWVNADTLDKPDPTIKDTPQLYSLNAVAYESILLGEFYIHLGPTNKIAEDGKYPKITELKLGFSRDGFHWDRPNRDPFIKASKIEGDWQRGYVHGTNGVLLVHDDKLWFPFTAFSGVTPDGSKGMYKGASIGMATLRRDGFAAMEAVNEQGSLITRRLKFDGRYLFVNVNCSKGTLQVEILDENDKVIPALSKDNCEVISVDQTLKQVKWKGSPDLSALKSRAVKFKFYLKNGQLYSFWVSPDQSGASNGYLGAGGISYDGNVDHKGDQALIFK